MIIPSPDIDDSAAPLSAPNPTALVARAVDSLWPAARRETSAGSDVSRFSQIVRIENLLDEQFPLGYNYPDPLNRWKRYCHSYIPDDFLAWLDELRTAITEKRRPSMERPVFMASRGKHTIGGCLIYLGFRPGNRTLTMFSRAALLFPAGILDLNLAQLLAAHLHPYFAQPGPIRLYWSISTLWFRPQAAACYLAEKGLLPHFEDPGAPSYYSKLDLNSTWRGFRLLAKDYQRMQETGSLHLMLPDSVWVAGQQHQLRAIDH